MVATVQHSLILRVLPAAAGALLASAAIANAVLPSVRIALLCLTVFHISWTLLGTIRSVRDPRPLALFQASLFFVSLGTFAFQVFAVFGHPNDTTRLASSLTLCVGLLAAVPLRWQVKHLRKFTVLLDHVEVSFAIADLARVDPDAARQIAAQCRLLTARLITDAG